MNRVVNILNQSKPFFFATIDGKFPKVRPYNAVVEFEDKVYFYTNNFHNLKYKIKKAFSQRLLIFSIISH